MPAPSTTLTQYRPDIGTLFQWDAMAARRGFIAQRVLPTFESAVQAGTYGIVPLKQLLKEPQVGRNDRGDYNRSGFTFQDTSFATKERGIEVPMDDRQARMYRQFFDFEVACTEAALDIVLRAAEKRVADAIFNATTFASYTAAVSNEWDDYTNATPVTDVETAVRAVWAVTGLWPNSLIVNKKVFRNLRMCDEVTDKIASTGAGVSIEPGKITAAMLATVFDLEQVVVADAARDSANEGQAVTVAATWSDEYAMVARLNGPSDGIEVPGLGRTIHWGEDGSTIGGTVERYYSDESRSEIVRARHDVEEKIVYTACGYLLSNITT